jgi:hypothetical protein
MPGELKLYRDYELTDESEVASAAGNTSGCKCTKMALWLYTFGFKAMIKFCVFWGNGVC